MSNIENIVGVSICSVFCGDAGAGRWPLWTKPPCWELLLVLFKMNFIDPKVGNDTVAALNEQKLHSHDQHFAHSWLMQHIEEKLNYWPF